MEAEIFDLTIVGAGPAGLFAAYYAGLRQMKVKIIESLDAPGGQLTLLYPEKEIKDVAGFTSITARQLVENLSQQLANIEATICYNEEVTQLEKKDDLFFLTTGKETHVSKAVLLTTGGGAFVPRKLTIGAAKALEGKKIFYQVDNLKKYSGRNVALLGGGDSAVDWALALESIAKEVSLIHRRTQFRALEHSTNLLMQSKVEVLTPFVLEDLKEDGQQLELSLRHVKTKDIFKIMVDDLLVNYGFINTHQTLVDENLQSPDGKIIVDSTGATALPGLFACGDIASYPGKIQLIATGFGEAPTAVNNIHFYLHPESRLQPAHSTSL